MDMEMHWHEVDLVCPKCDSGLVINALLASADGEIALKMVCSVCEVDLFWKTSGAHLICGAMRADMKCQAREEDSLKSQQKSPKSQKLFTPPAVTPTHEERKWLFDIGVDQDSWEK